MNPSVRRALPLLAIALVVAIVLVVFDNDRATNRTELNLRLANASGLRDGSAVKVGGADVGKVEGFDVDRRGVLVRLELENDKVVPGAGVKASVSTVNLLGSKFVDLVPGDPGKPLKDGTTLPASEVLVSTDLDQVLDVVDADTRTRLAVLINEAGELLDGHVNNLRGALRELPPSLMAGQRLLSSLATDNRTLGEAIDRSDAFVDTLADQRRQLTDTVDAAGDAATTFAQRRERLGETLDKAPATLRSAQRFLGELQRTTGPLGPAARQLQATAGPLKDTLDELQTFDDTAEPALKAAKQTAPKLTDLATGATPVVDRAEPVVQNLAALAEQAKPASKAADESIDDALGVLEGWARTTSGGDRAGHVFRGRVPAGAETVRSLLGSILTSEADSLRKGTTAGAKKKSRRSKSPASPPATAAPPSAPPAATTPKPAAPAASTPDKGLLDGLVDGVDGVLQGLGGSPGSKSAPAPSLSDTLDKLLGR